MNNLIIRAIEERDIAGALKIYAQYVQHTPVSFEYEVPSLEEFGKRIQTNTSKYPCLVCVQNDTVVGYAYATDFRYRAAYQWSPESTIYVQEGFHGKGIGKVLYGALFEILKAQGYYNVFAGLAIPNEKSEGIHRAMGFREIGVFENIGYKQGKWHTTKWFQLILAPHINEPALPLKPETIMNSAQVQDILTAANKKLSF